MLEIEGYAFAFGLCFSRLIILKNYASILYQCLAVGGRIFLNSICNIAFLCLVLLRKKTVVTNDDLGEGLVVEKGNLFNHQSS